MTRTMEPDLVGYQLIARPLRRAYIVPADASCQDLLWCIAEAAEAWGGWGDILVPWGPTGTDPVFLAFLRGHSPDLVMGLYQEANSASGTVRQYVDQIQGIGLAPSEFARVNAWGDSHHVRAIDTLPSYEQDRPVVHMGEGCDALRLMVAAHAGHTENKLPGELERVAVGGEDLSAATTAIRLVEQPRHRGLPMPAQKTLFRCGLWEVGPYWNPPGPTWRDVRSLVVIGSAVPDYCLYYDLLHHGPPVNVYWVPTSCEMVAQGEDTPVKPGAEAWIGHVRQAVMLSLGPSDDRAVVGVVSISHKEEQALAVCASAWQERVLVESPPQWRWLPPDGALARQQSWLKMTEFDRPRQRGVALFRGGRLSAPLSPPIPSGFSREHLGRSDWVTEVVLDDLDHAFPSRACLHGLVVEDDAQWGKSRGRATRAGAAFLGTREVVGSTDLEFQLAELRPRCPTATQAMRAIFESAGLHIRPSSAGEYSRESVQLFGGLDLFARSLREPATRHLLERLSDTARKPARGVYDEGWLVPNEDAAQKRRCANMEAIEKWLGDQSANDQAEAIVEQWLGAGVLRRGILHECGQCSLTSWYSVEDMDETIRCWRCAGRSRLSLRAEWQFRLAEVVHQCIDHNARVPLLTLDYLRRGSAKFAWVEEQDVRQSPDDEVPWMEVDIACFADGELILGEARKTAKLGDDASNAKTKVDKYRELALRLRPDRLVFATMADKWGTVAERLLGRLRDDLAGVATEVQALTRAELET